MAASRDLGWEGVMAWRGARHGLAARAPAQAWLDVVRRICGLHAQVHSSAQLTLWARTDGLAREQLDDALWRDRTVVKTWAMRGTLHILPADELAMWVGAQGALAPRYETASWRKASGMSSEQAVAVLDAIRSALDGEPLTRDELADAVGRLLDDRRLGETVRGSWGTMPKLAALRGDVVFAPPRGQKVRFTRPDRWLRAGWAPDPPREAMAAVIRRYLAANGPATREGFARWFGMASAAQAGRLIAGLGDELAAVTLGGRQGWMLRADVVQAAAAAPAGVVALLPAFDQYVVAAPRDPSPVLAPEHKARVYRPQGWLSPVLLVDGRIEGVWRHERKLAELTIEPFGDLGQIVRAAAQAQAQRLAEHLGDDLDVVWA